MLFDITGYAQIKMLIRKCLQVSALEFHSFLESTIFRWSGSSDPRYSPEALAQMPEEFVT